MNEYPPAPGTVAPQPKTSGLAIWSLVLGILSFLMCLSIFTAIPGVICAHKALGKIKRSGGLITGQGLAIAGMVIGYLAIAWAVVFVPMMIAIAIPNFVKARESSQMNGCINNLRQIESAKQRWAQINNKTGTAIPTPENLDGLLPNGGFGALKCPAGGTYMINSVDSEPTCSIANHSLSK